MGKTDSDGEEDDRPQSEEVWEVKEEEEEEEEGESISLAGPVD